MLTYHVNQIFLFINSKYLIGNGKCGNNNNFTAGSDDTALKRVAPRFVICPHSFAETVLKEVSAENILTFDKNDEGLASVEALLAKNTQIDEQFRFDNACESFIRN